MSETQPTTTAMLAMNQLVESECDNAVALVAGLSPTQQTAFEILTRGGTIAAAARAAKVTRRTLYAWLEADHPFASAYEQWKLSIAETSRTRLLMIGEAATVQIARAVNAGDTRAALAVAKGMGLLSSPPVGPSLTQTQRDAKQQAIRKTARKEAAAVEFAELLNVEKMQEELRAVEQSDPQEQQ